MTEPGMQFALSLAAALVAGAGLGVAYLWALWYTVRRQATARRPALWLLLSAAARMALLLGGFYAVMAGSWQRLLVCVGGFLVARVVMMKRLGPAAAPARRPAAPGDTP